MQTRATASLLAWSLALAACGDAGRDAAGGRPAGDTALAGGAADTAGNQATASMRNPAGVDLGTLTLTDGDQDITVAGRLTGLPPGEHAIHLHATGRCDAPAFESAGDHWNPTNSQHGTESPKGPHLGDLLNITVGQDSSVTVEGATPGGTLSGQNELQDADSAAVVVHAKPDDYRSQPSGDSGDRIACGVVTGS